MSVSPVKISRKSTVSESSSSEASCSRASKPRLSRVDNIVPFEFQGERAVFGPKLENVSFTDPKGTKVSYCEPAVNYRYESGNTGPLSVTFRNVKVIVYKGEDKIMVTRVKKGEEVVAERSVPVQKADLCMSFEVDPNFQPVPRALFDPDCEDDSLITHQEIIDSLIGADGFFDRLVTSGAAFVKENCFKQKSFTSVVEMADTSRPFHPKNKQTEQPDETKPKIFYYPLTSYCYLSNKSDIKSVVYVQTPINIAASRETFTWDEASKYILTADVVVQYSNLHIKGNAWKVKGEVVSVLVTGRKLKERATEAIIRANQSRYEGNAEAAANARAMEEELRQLRLQNQELKAQEHQLKAQIETDKPKGSKTVNLPNDSDDDEDEEDLKSFLTRNSSIKPKKSGSGSDEEESKRKSKKAEPEEEPKRKSKKTELPEDEEPKPKRRTNVVELEDEEEFEIKAKPRRKSKKAEEEVEVEVEEN